MPRRFELPKLGLMTKVLLVVLGTALVTSGLFAFGINAVIRDRFEDYLDHSIEQRNERIVQVIEEIYSQTRDWGVVADRLDSIAPTINTIVRVKNLNGNLVLDSTSGRMHNWMMRQGMMGPGMMWGRGWNTRTGPDNDYYSDSDVLTYPLHYQGQRIGTAEIIVVGVRGELSQEDIEFKESIHDAVITASLTAGLLALLLSIIFAFRVTRPILELTKVAEKLRDGNFQARAKIGRRDELGTLATAFNNMARRLDELDQMRKKFTSDVAHELRTPVTTIRSYIEGFQDGVLEPTPEKLKDLEEETLRLTELISDLQDLTLIENGKLVMNIGEFNLSEEVQSFLKRLGPLFAEKNIKLEADIEENISVYGDQKLLSRAFGNLINNALKYTSAGGNVLVVVGYRHGAVEISVQDTGSGIPEKDLPYIFDRFYRADPSRARKSGGSGIGLAIVKEIIEAHGGRVTVDSRPGDGSTFTIRLPKGK